MLELQFFQPSRLTPSPNAPLPAFPCFRYEYFGN